MCVCVCGGGGGSLAFDREKRIDHFMTTDPDLSYRLMGW